jgi:hypothetical protein
MIRDSFDHADDDMGARLLTVERVEADRILGATRVALVARPICWSRASAKPSRPAMASAGIGQGWARTTLAIRGARPGARRGQHHDSRCRGRRARPARLGLRRRVRLFELPRLRQRRGWRIISPAGRLNEEDRSTALSTSARIRALAASRNLLKDRLVRGGNHPREPRRLSSTSTPTSVPSSGPLWRQAIPCRP